MKNDFPIHFSPNDLKMSNHTDEELGTPCWMATITDLAKLVPKLANFYENENFSDLEIYVAGSVEPDPAALTLVNNILSNLSQFFEIIDDDIGFNCDDGWLAPSELCVPFQSGWIIEEPYPQYSLQVGINPSWLFYIQLWSEYGSGPSFIFFEDDKGKFFTGKIINTSKRFIKKEGAKQLVVSELKQRQFRL